MSAIDRLITSARGILAAPPGQKFLDPKMNITEDPDQRADVYDVIQCLATNIIQKYQIEPLLKVVRNEIFAICPPKLPKSALESREHLTAFLAAQRTPSPKIKELPSGETLDRLSVQIMTLFFRVTEPLLHIVESPFPAEVEHLMKMGLHRYELQRMLFLLNMQTEWFCLHWNGVAINHFFIPHFAKQLPEGVAEAIAFFGLEKEKTQVEHQSHIFKILKPFEPQSEIGKALFIRLLAKKPPKKQESLEGLISRNLLIFFAKSGVIEQIQKTSPGLSEEYVKGLEELNHYANLLLYSLYYSHLVLYQIGLKERMALMKTARENLLEFITASTIDAKGNPENDRTKRLDDLFDITPFLFSFDGWTEKEEAISTAPASSTSDTSRGSISYEREGMAGLKKQYIEANSQASYEKIWRILKSEEVFAKNRKINRMTGSRYLGSVDAFTPAFSGKNNQVTGTGGYHLESKGQKEQRIFHEKEEAFFLSLQMSLYGTHKLSDYERWRNHLLIVGDIPTSEDLLDIEGERKAVEKAIQFLEHSQSSSMKASASSTEATAGAGAASASSHPVSESEASSDEVDEDFTSMVSPLDLSKDELRTPKTLHKYDNRVLQWWENPAAILSSKAYRDRSEDERRFQEAAHAFPLYIDERLIPRNSKEVPSPYCIVGDWMIKKEKHVCYMIPGEILMDGKVFRGAFEITVDRRGIIYHRHFVRETEKQSLFEVLHTTKHWPGELPNIKEAAIPPTITEDEKGLKVAESSFGTIRMTTPKGITYVLYRAR